MQEITDAHGLPGHLLLSGHPEIGPLLTSRDALVGGMSKDKSQGMPGVGKRRAVRSSLYLK